MVAGRGGQTVSQCLSVTLQSLQSIITINFQELSCWTKQGNLTSLRPRLVNTQGCQTLTDSFDITWEPRVLVQSSGSSFSCWSWWTVWLRVLAGVARWSVLFSDKSQSSIKIIMITNEESWRVPPDPASNSNKGINYRRLRPSPWLSSLDLNFAFFD